ncbi:unnamed protein product, partial [Prorocentrum cordatum]
QPISTRAYPVVGSTRIVRVGNFPKDALASLPPRPILGCFRWPYTARKASRWASKVTASSSRILLIRADCTEKPPNKLVFTSRAGRGRGRRTDLTRCQAVERPAHYGVALSNSTDDDPLYGNSARVDLYNQLQAGVRFELTRPNTNSFGTTPYVCSSEFECSICRDTLDNGFFSVDTVRAGISENLTAACSHEATADRRMEGDQPNEARRLRLGDMTLRPFLPMSAESSGDTFAFNRPLDVYPAEPLDNILTRLRYYRDRGWLDTDTQTVKLSMYFLNSELGRPRLEQLIITFHLSASGEIVYER